MRLKVTFTMFRHTFHSERILLPTASIIGVLVLCVTLFGGCFTQFALDGEDVSELKMTPDRKVAFFLVNDDVVDAKRFQYVYGTDSADGILGKGTRTVPLTGEVSEFRDFLPMKELDSLSLREGGWHCWVRGGTLVSMREADAIRVTPSTHPGFWIVGASQRGRPGILFRGFLPDSTIAEVKVDRVSLVGTVVMVAISTFVVIGLALVVGG